MLLTGVTWSATPCNHLVREQFGYQTTLTGVVPASFVVDSQSKMARVLELLRKSGPVAIDTEYESTDHGGDGTLVSLQLSGGNWRVFVPANKLEPLRAWIESHAPKIYHWGIGADVPALERAGFRPKGFFADTQVLDILVDERRIRQKRTGLKAAVLDWLGLFLGSFESLTSGLSTAEAYARHPDDFVDYATADAYGTFWLYKHHRMLLENLRVDSKRSLWDYHQAVEQPFWGALKAVRDRGMAVDAAKLDELERLYRWDARRLKELVAQSAPDITVQRKVKGGLVDVRYSARDLNLNSSKQMAALFYGELGMENLARDQKLGRLRSVDKEHLTAWAPTCKLADYVRDYRRAEKLRTTFVGQREPIRKKRFGILGHMVAVNDRYGQYHAVYSDLSETGTVTGRLTAQRPNVQQIPADPRKDHHGLRRAFVARPGHRLIVADYSLFEMRILAHVSKDATLQKALFDGVDLHGDTAVRVLGAQCAPDEVKEKFPELRRQAKGINFGIAYGRGPASLAAELGVTFDDAEELLRDYFRVYSGVQAWIQHTIAQCHNVGYTQTIFGRRRRFPDIWLRGEENAKERLAAERECINHPIQGTVGDITKIVMAKVYCDPWFVEHEAFLTCQVHDELIAEAPEVDADVVASWLKKQMETTVRLSVPLTVSIGVADSWHDAKD